MTERVSRVNKNEFKEIKKVILQFLFKTSILSESKQAESLNPTKLEKRKPSAEIDLWEVLWIMEINRYFRIRLVKTSDSVTS